MSNPTTESNPPIPSNDAEGHERRQEPFMVSRIRPRKASQPAPKPQTDPPRSAAPPSPEAAPLPPGDADSPVGSNEVKPPATEPVGQFSPPQPPAAPQAEAPGDALEGSPNESPEAEADATQAVVGEGEIPAEGEPEVIADAKAETGVLDAVPVAEHKGGGLTESPAEGQILEVCPACGTRMDVSLLDPFMKIDCPGCSQALRVRRQFNHYKLLELVGQGGMGQVFRALDCNLNRQVALKILKKEIAASDEERDKLATEARLTASIHHPHVVKVFSFGQDHGQFYMAMELVPNSSLDELLAIQRRVSEAQVLEIGIQVAQGLNAAFEKGLLHRDIKPGNILFSDAHTAKLVDFGLAIVADEAAAAVGEIWGTPYYIAPEKLDNQPEDIRSDIYSLGGTLFHALAGRPPYEADTASMVALKQLKSQPISLQSFAPDVSSETSYVVNRMLAKNPAERYDTYGELVEHLQYARNKVMERINQPQQPKARVVLETKQTRTFGAILSLVLLLTVVVAAGLTYAFRDRIFARDAAAATASAYDPASFASGLESAIGLANEKKFEEALKEFTSLSKVSGLPQPQLNWAFMNIGLMQLAMGKTEEAAATFKDLHRAGLYSEAKDDLPMASYFVEVGRLLSNPKRPIEAATSRLYSSSNHESFALFAFALHNINLDQKAAAEQLLTQFLRGRNPSAEPWIANYKPLARSLLDGLKE